MKLTCAFCFKNNRRNCEKVNIYRLKNDDVFHIIVETKVINRAGHTSHRYENIRDDEITYLKPLPALTAAFRSILVTDLNNFNYKIDKKDFLILKKAML